MSVRALSSRSHVQWWDNFSKTYAVSVHRVEVGAYRDCQWTGRGLHELDAPQDLLRVDALGLNQAMVSDLFLPEIEAAFRREFGLVQAQDSTWRGQSLCVRFKVNTVPPKPVLQMGDNETLWLRIQKKRDGLHTFHPMSMAAVNCGSNDGLLSLLRQLYEEQLLVPEGEKFVKVVVSDVNLYKRFMKVTFISCPHVQTLLCSSRRTSVAWATALSTNFSLLSWAPGTRSSMPQLQSGAWLPVFSSVPSSTTFFRAHSSKWARRPHHDSAQSHTRYR